MVIATISDDVVIGFRLHRLSVDIKCEIRHHNSLVLTINNVNAFWF
jgi:hypothetical protein